MSVRVKMEDMRFSARIDELTAPEEQSKRLAGFAREVLAESQAVNRAVLGRVPPHKTFVDRRETDDIESVRPDGRIVFEFRLIQEVIEWIGEQLLLASPVLSGTYVKSHILFADGIEVTPGAAPSDAKEWVFVNTQPYSRKIDRGLSAQAPDGVYDAVSAVAATRFGNLVKVYYTFRALAGDKRDRQPAIMVRL